jgi:peptide/nickel transport system substrate-binding protein
MKKIEKIHPAIYDLKVDMDKGKITRRQFLRYATLLGMSAVTASQMAGLIWPKKAIAAQKRGGVLRFGMQVQEMADPGTYSWTQKSIVSRHMVEYPT